MLPGGTTVVSQRAFVTVMRLAIQDYRAFMMDAAMYLTITVGDLHLYVRWRYHMRVNRARQFLASTRLYAFRAVEGAAPYDAAVIRHGARLAAMGVSPFVAVASNQTCSRRVLPFAVATLRHMRCRKQAGRRHSSVVVAVTFRPRRRDALASVFCIAVV